MKILDVPTNVLNLLALETASTAWPAPEIIRQELPPVPPFSPALLPAPLRAAVSDITHRMQCPIEYVAGPLICAFGAAIGTTLSVRPKQHDNWALTPNVWGAVIGAPGRMKSPAISAALGPLYRLDRMLQQDYEQNRSGYDVQMLGYKAREDTLKEELKRASKGPTKSAPAPRAIATIEADLAQLRLNLPQEPIRLRCFTNDATLEALGIILDKNPKGVLVVQDELMGLLSTFEKPGREGERQGYLSGWNGDAPVHIDRVSRDHLYIDPFCISVVGGIQPDRLARYMADNMGSHGNDGLLQRFQVMFYPDDVPEGPVVDQVPDSSALDQLNDLMVNIANQRIPLGADLEPGNRRPFFRFDHAAQPLVYAWLQELDSRVRRQEHAILAEHLSKYRKLVPSLALIFHVIEIASGHIPAGAKISRETFELARAWGDLLEDHARRIYSISTNVRIQAATALAKKIKAGKLQSGFSHRDIQHHDWSMLKDVDTIREACHELEAAYWIRPIPRQGKATTGRPLGPCYEINPAVLP